MSKYLGILLTFILIPSSLFALSEEDNFRIYKKPLLTGVEIAQTDTHTELLYKGEVIKRFVNAEFPTEILPHGPDEEPDCYNSLQNHAPSDRAKNIIGKEYLRSCLVLQTKLLRNKIILFYGPALEGNKVSVYNIRTKKFTYGAANSVIKASASMKGSVVFLTKNTGFACERSIYLYKDSISRKIFDECSLKNSGIPYIKIYTFQILPKKIIITYFPYRDDGSGNITPDTSKKFKKILPL